MVSKNRKRKKVIGMFLLLSLVTPIMLLIISNFLITNSADNKTFQSVDNIPFNKVGLVLGTAKILKNGQVNLYFKYRIAATTKLYRNGKIQYVLVSGDNGHEGYDEPTDFKNELIKNGIPADKIYLDYAGFRTLDSVVRAKKIFGQSKITFISQKFHNERAIYLAKHFGIDAIGFNAKDVSKKFGLKVRIREYFARTKAFLDILLNVQPKFLGKKIIID